MVSRRCFSKYWRQLLFICFLFSVFVWAIRVRRTPPAEHNTQDVTHPPPKYPIVGYSRVDTMNCIHPLCRLNRGRTPVRVHRGHSTCHAVSECVTLIAKTHFRLNAVANLIRSFHKYYPFTQVVVVDDFNPAYPAQYNTSSPWAVVYQGGRGNVTYVQAEQGISHGRNIAMRLITTKYALLADDDMLFTDNTDVATMLRLLEETDASIVGGTFDAGSEFDALIRVHQSNQSVNLGWYGGIYYQRVEPRVPCYVTDRVLNFFLFNRNQILATGAWDQVFEVCEHKDFFTSMRDHGIKTIYCSHITFIHDKGVSDQLRKERMKTRGKFHHMRQLKWGYTKDLSCKPEKYIRHDKCFEK